MNGWIYLWKMPKFEGSFVFGEINEALPLEGISNLTSLREFSSLLTKLNNLIHLKVNLTLVMCRKLNFIHKFVNFHLKMQNLRHSYQKFTTIHKWKKKNNKQREARDHQTS